MSKLELSKVIQDLRSEISDAMAEASKEQLLFEIGEILLEFHVAIESSTVAGGGINFWVLDANGEVATSNLQTHKVKIPLRPINKDGGPVLTGDGETPS